MGEQSKYSRRRFLSSVGLGAAALPLLEAPDAFGNCLATPPKRVLFLVYPNGSDGTGKYITGGEKDFVLPTWMKESVTPGGATLESLRSELLFLDGLRNNTGEAASHENRPCVFTGVKLSLNDGHSNHRVIPGGPSIDQVMVKQAEIQGIKTARPSLNLGVRSNGYRAAFRSEKDPISPEQDPFKLVGSLFGDVSAGGSPVSDVAAQKRWASRKLVMEQKLREVQAFKKTLGTADQFIVDSWTQSIADIQRELMTPPPVLTAGCGKPDLGTVFDVKSTDNHGKILKTQMDLAVAALAADVTRIGMIEVDDSWGDSTVMTWLGAGFESGGQQDTANGNNHHHLSHENGAKMLRVEAWYHGMWAYLIDRMSKYREGDGSLLDNTVVIIANDGKNGASHSTNNVPWLVAGGKNLGLDRGRYLKLGNPPKNGLLVAAAQRMGLDIKDFGGIGAMTGLT